MELNPKIKQVLEEINFVNRYEILSKEFNSTRTSLQEMLTYIDGETVMDIVIELGYDINFNRKDKFFYVDENIEDFKFSFRFVLDGGLMDFIFVAWEKDKLLVGSPWGIYSRLLINPDYQIMKPVYGDYDDLDEILKVGFEIYSDFKNSLLNLAK